MMYVGIDVASEKHDCAILDSESGEVCDFSVFANNREGFDKLVARLAMFSKTNDFSDIEIRLESTGHYSNNFVNFIHEKRLSIKVLTRCRFSGYVKYKPYAEPKPTNRMRSFWHVC